MFALRAVTLLTLCAAPLSAADWPQRHGPKRDGSTPEIVEAWKDAPKELWRVKTGPGFASPVVVGGKVFVHSRVPDTDREEMAALDAKTGKDVWRTAYDRGPFASTLGTGPQATPTVAGGKVFAFGITGVLACLDAESGKLLWKVEPFKLLGAKLPRYGVTCSPLVIGDRVLVAVGGKGSSVAAFNAETGELAWQALDDSANTSSPTLLAGKGRKIPEAVFMTTLRVVGLSPLDGKVVWEFPLPFQPSGTAPSPVVAGDLVVTSTTSNGTTAIRPGSSEPAKAWQSKDVGGYFSTGTGAKDKLFLISNKLQPLPRADLACVDAATGKTLWTKEGLGYFHFAVIRTGNDRILLLDDGGKLKLIDASASEYRELAAAKVCGGNLVAPALSDGKLFVRDDAGLACIALAP